MRGVLHITDSNSDAAEDAQLIPGFLADRQALGLQ
jgi:hypothetical protein